MTRRRDKGGVLPLPPVLPFCHVSFAFPLNSSACRFPLTFFCFLLSVMLHELQRTERTLNPLDLVVLHNDQIQALGQVGLMPGHTPRCLSQPTQTLMCNVKAPYFPLSSVIISLHKYFFLSFSLSPKSVFIMVCFIKMVRNCFH